MTPRPHKLRARRAQVLGLEAKPIHRRMVRDIRVIDGQLLGLVRHHHATYTVRQVDDDEYLWAYVEWDPIANQWRRAQLNGEGK